MLQRSDVFTSSEVISNCGLLYVQMLHTFLVGTISLAKNFFLNYLSRRLHLRPNCSFLFTSIILTISLANEPSSDAGFEPDDALRIQLPVRLSAVCLSASTLDAVHPTVPKLITVIRLKKRGTGHQLAWGMLPLDFPSETENLSVADLLGPGPADACT